MEASGQLHDLAAVMEPPVPIRQKGGWASVPVWRRWRKKIPASARNPNPVDDVFV